MEDSNQQSCGNKYHGELEGQKDYYNKFKVIFKN